MEFLCNGVTSGICQGSLKMNLLSIFISGFWVGEKNEGLDEA